MVTFALRIAGTDWSCETLTSWTVTYGRSDPDSFPTAARGSWTMILDGGLRAPSVQPGALVEFTATVGSTTLPVATLRVSGVKRDFSFFRGEGRNTITVEAGGPTVMLERKVLPKDFASSFAEETDGARAARVLWETETVPMPVGRTPQNHVVNDRLYPTGNAGLVWTDNGTATLTGPLVTFSRKGTLPTLGISGGFVEMEWTFTADGPIEFSTPFSGSTMYSGTGVLSHREIIPYIGGATVPSPQFTVRPFNPAKSLSWADGDKFATNAPHHWPDAAGKWSDSAAAGPVHFRLTDFDAWDLAGAKWDFGGEPLCNRAPKQDETALAHIQTIATTCRGVLWENRDGTVIYQSRHSRSATSPVELDLDGCRVVAATSSDVDLSKIVNRAQQSYGYDTSLSDRPYYDTGPPSPAEVAAHGELMRTNDGPLRTKEAAVAICAQVLAGHSQPHERLNGVQLVPFERMSDTEVLALLRLPLGSVIEIHNVPREGWVAKGRWKGFVEGTTIVGQTIRTSTGPKSETVMSLNLTEFLTVTGVVPSPKSPVMGADTWRHGVELATMASPPPTPLIGGKP
jgi:hypothetical protein